MSWLSSGSTNEHLINNLFSNKLIKSVFIKNAMAKVDRKNYLKIGETLRYAYEDRPLPINASVTISAPHMHAMALELATEQFQRPTCRCLDVGSGSGYLIACMLHILRDLHGEQLDHLPKPRVVGIEYLEDLVPHSKQALEKDLQQHGVDAAGLWRIVQGDGWKGVPEYAPYDVIHVGAAADHIPKKLTDQLAIGGRMIIPVGPQSSTQYLTIVDKLPDGTTSIRKVCGVGYVPLVNPSNEA